MRRAASSVADAVMISAPSALAISNPRSISVVGEAGVRAVVERVDRDAGGLELLPDRAEVIEGRLESPLPQGLSRLLHLRR